MVVIPPPRQPDSREVGSIVEPHRDGEAFIEEAKQHARLRRRRIAVIAVAASIAVIGVAAATISSGAGSSDEPSSGNGEPASVAVPPEEEPAALVASWGEIHVGWIRIYADGRVVRVGVPLKERRLTPEGLEVVRSGVLSARDVYMLRDSAFDWIWADAGLRPYEPAEYALCYWVQLEASGFPLPASVVFDRLAPAAQALVRGTERDFDIVEAFGMAEWPRHECFSVSPVAAEAFVRHQDASSSNQDGGPESPDLWLEPVLPDGKLIRWGG